MDLSCYPMRQNLLTNVRISIIRAMRGGLAWNDPEIGVEWPIEEGMKLIISEKDQKWGG